MQYIMKRSFLWILYLLTANIVYGQVANKYSYLEKLKKEMSLAWPKNRTLNIVFHGHSVPTGYTCTPVVNSLQAYPHLVLHGLKSQYPFAVINIITTSIGGEQAEQGQKRFKDEVLIHNPDILFIDYALNDRGIGLERAEKAWRKMIEMALKKHINIILLTPTPDLNENILDEESSLKAHANMIRRLSEEYKIGLVDSYKLFENKARDGEDLKHYMSQNNHPNSAGHSCVAAEILTWFY